MIISGKNLRLYYHSEGKNGAMGGFCNMPEVEKGEYGYDLQRGQQVFCETGTVKH